jgi:hypothetical protein
MDKVARHGERDTFAGEEFSTLLFVLNEVCGKYRMRHGAAQTQKKALRKEGQSALERLLRKEETFRERVPARNGL